MFTIETNLKEKDVKSEWIQNKKIWLQHKIPSHGILPEIIWKCHDHCVEIEKGFSSPGFSSPNYEEMSDDT
jgi:hypothetical protein